MMRHPAILMLGVWATAWLLLLGVLPMRLTRPLSLYGLAVLGLFLASFCLGTWLSRGVRIAARPLPQTDALFVDRLLAAVALIAIGAFAVDIMIGGPLNLPARSVWRAQVSQDLFFGRSSSSSLAYKLAFLTYPASFVYLARQIVLSRSIGMFRLALFAILPTVAASIATGGGGPLVYTMVIGLVSLLVRRAGPLSNRGWIAAGGSVGAVAALIYFARIFAVRAARSGGVPSLLAHAPQDWGVRMAAQPIWTALLGPFGTFLLFMAGWYFVQGLVVSNTIFTAYAGPMQWGVNGADLIVAIVRRVDPALMVRDFRALKDIGVYGLLPSAFGSLYIDFRWAGPVICMGWGYVAGLAWRNAATNSGWALAEPFVITGIMFSTSNTPIALANGLVTHGWLVIACMLGQRRGMADK
ncbi:hypothetical protein SPAN111604_04180 [Sphingomonas antarctica]|uniref:O-antigen polymerase n=1 Tax=Sphingomonas antarctica TaxID=2040274 RepID=UPI0039E8EF93